MFALDQSIEDEVCRGGTRRHSRSLIQEEVFSVTRRVLGEGQWAAVVVGVGKVRDSQCGVTTRRGIAHLAFVID